ncbi:hypothetical protein L1987_17496 [Smallanthus sonchifolius]|uniref:Uncharacterized protein n=1 Tax=Smallanthus sonchifolius TaxID=185202 RepID=A0ACB9IWY6_9ASTR|nr:hypothetical protein L1987_17496 [Smallanthus sonchifolius]
MDVEAASPTVEELISQLRSSFFSLEFQHVAKTLIEREEQMNDKYLKLKTKAQQEKDLLISENLKLNDELKKKQNEIDAIRKLNDEYERKFRVYEKRCLDFDHKVLNLEKLAKESVCFRSSSVSLENKEQKDCAAESNRETLFCEKKDSKKKTEPKLKEIIHIDDDDDDDHK